MAHIVPEWKFGEHLNQVWERKPAKMDWEGLETTLVDVLSSTMTPDEKIAFAKETIDAYTRRGHFAREEYAEAR